MFVFAIARPLLTKVKLSTGMPGVKVVPIARDVLIDLYTQTLTEIKALQKYGDGDEYRPALEEMVESRLDVCRKELDWEAIERRIACGQIEDLIDQAREDLALLRKCIECEVWKLHDLTAKEREKLHGMTIHR